MSPRNGTSWKSSGRRLGCLSLIINPHGHDAFLMAWDQVTAWLERLLPDAV